ncbi:hypothetical protein BY996DRAFT_6413854 [Phakopsora pachyrhizi]|nr:hypothetical protein BY996DRAFT_6413854 [Phakopsora pachyrhizi]
MSPHPEYLMASQRSPAMPHTLPFISSPDSTNTTTSSSAPARSTTPFGQRPASFYSNDSVQHFQSNPLTHTGHDSNQKNQQQRNSDIKLSPFPAVVQKDDSPEVSSDPEQHTSHISRPVLETDGVVSSEVGEVPGILHQDLHPDGQPRRPMNAFMIFARHRRPAIQAKEPGLKTGEISKRLSHDWKNLPEEDKLHYLEQAKLLKDEFHSRFPEYVYKRRPNNTGKRRSSTSQQQLPTKFTCGPGAPQMMGPPMNGVMTHRPDIHAHPHHRQLHGQVRGDIYQTHSHHMPPHPHQHAQPPCRPLSSLAQPSPKMGGHHFYAANNDPSSPRYHQIGHSFSKPCGTIPQRVQPAPGQYPSLPRGSAIDSNSTAVGTATSIAHSPRSASPGPSPVTAPDGISNTYLRLPSSHGGTHPSQQSPGNYPWFSNDHHYATSSAHPHQAQTPLSANRSSFYYPSWPASGTPDSQSLCASDAGSASVGHNASDGSQQVNHSRAASYSAGPSLYRPPSPMDRSRQLSLPSHAMSNSAGAEGPNSAPNSIGLAYSTRSQSENQQGEAPSLNSTPSHAGYGAYSSQDVASSAPRSYPPSSINGGYNNVNGGRNNIVRSGCNQSSGGLESVNQNYEPQSQLQQQSGTGPTNSTHQSNGFGSHYSSIHQPISQANSASSGHHAHPAAHTTSTNNVATSVAY